MPNQRLVRFSADLGKAVTLNNNLFQHSSVEHVVIPKTVKYAEGSALRDASDLIELNILAQDFKVKEDFARNCTKLEKVTSKYPLASIENRAFMNCPSLKEFPFKASTDWDGRNNTTEKIIIQ